MHHLVSMLTSSVGWLANRPSKCELYKDGGDAIHITMVIILVLKYEFILFYDNGSSRGYYLLSE